MSIASRGASMAIDWEQRIDFARLRKHLRYVTSTAIGPWKRRFPAEELLVAGQGYVRGPDMVEGRPVEGNGSAPLFSGAAPPPPTGT